MIDRRSVGLGVIAGLAVGTARAAPDKPLFVSGPMSSNALAKGFRTAPGTVILPNTPLVSADGPRRLSDLRGRTWIVSLWAEWCVACLEEAPDLAAVARTHAGPTFGVLFVLTSSFKKLDFAGARAVLDKRGAGDAPLLVEPRGGNAVMMALAAQDEHSRGALPCNLLIDRHGRLRARSFGAPSRMTISHSGPLTEAEKALALTQPTLWATPAGGQFATALAAGLLDEAQL